MKKLLSIFLFPFFLSGQTVQEAIESFKENSLTLDAVIEGDETTTVTTPDGALIDSIRKSLNDNFTNPSWGFVDFAEMVAYDFTNTPDGTIIRCNGYNNDNDGFFGPDMYWDATSTATADGLTVINPTLPAGAGRLIRSFSTDVNLMWSGAHGDMQRNTTADITASDATLTADSGTFTSADVGKFIYVSGAGVSGATLKTTIASYTSGTEVELTATASTTVSNNTIIWATDDTTDIQATIDYCKDNDLSLYVPGRTFGISSDIEVYMGSNIYGDLIRSSNYTDGLPTNNIGSQFRWMSASAPTVACLISNLTGTEGFMQNMQIRRLRIDANGEANAAKLCGMNDNSILEDVEFFGYSGIGLELTETSDGIYTHAAHFIRMRYIGLAGATAALKLTKRVRQCVFTVGSIDNPGNEARRVSETDAAMTATDATLTSASAPFLATMVGDEITVEGAGIGGANHNTTIASFTSTSEVELTDVAITTVSGETIKTFKGVHAVGVKIMNGSYGNTFNNYRSENCDVGYEIGEDGNCQGTVFVNCDMGNPESGPGSKAVSLAIEDANWSANVATYDLPTHHRIEAGDIVTFTGMTPSGYNVTETVTAVTNNSISVAIVGDPGSSTVMGDVAFNTSIAFFIHDEATATNSYHIQGFRVDEGVDFVLFDDENKRYTRGDGSNAGIDPVMVIYRNQTQDGIAGEVFQDPSILRRPTGIQLDNVDASFSDGDTTPSIWGRSAWKTNNSSTTTTITDFDDGREGDLIEIFISDGGVINKTTISHSASKINLQGQESITPGVASILRFRRHSDRWYQVSGISPQDQILVNNIVKSNDSVSFADADATPSVLNGYRFLTANTGSTSITHFDNPTFNQVIEVFFGDGNTTIVDGSTIQLHGSANQLATTGSMMTFRYHTDSVWYETSRSIP
ncbi:hypothetical protein N8Z76_00345 [Gammaproteobacteria bacterium]|nr:hypothetical protein [Gammaproteobacteria bacterium]